MSLAKMRRHTFKQGYDLEQNKFEMAGENTKVVFRSGDMGSGLVINIRSISTLIIISQTLTHRGETWSFVTMQILI